MCLTTVLCLLGLQTGFCAAKTYQVTGPVLEITEKMIVIQKGDERWEIVRDEAKPFSGVIKVGDVVTVHYRMTATAIEPKSAREPKKAK
jgi:hypothetical protein